MIADPEAMTSQPEPELRASAMNALAHGADSLYTPFANPVSEMTALRGAELIAAALDEEREERDRAALALGSILCGYAIDSGLLRPPPRRLPDPGPRLRQPPRRDQRRDPAARDGLPGAAGAGAVRALAMRSAPTSMGFLRASSSSAAPRPLGELGADESKLDEAIEAMLQRPELARVPRPPVTREELSD